MSTATRRPSEEDVVVSGPAVAAGYLGRPGTMRGTRVMEAPARLTMALSRLVGMRSGTMTVSSRRRLPAGFSAIPTAGALAGISGLLTAVALALILVLALFLRLRDLHLAQGSLSGDEARLTLVAWGIAEHGWPVLPTGHLYTRGLFQ